MPLTPEQITIIKACVPILAEHGKTVTTKFYQNVLGENKSLNAVFNHTHQITGHQATALANAVFAYAKNIDNLEVLLPAVERIAQKHAAVFIREEHYPIVGAYLLAAMKEVLGEAFTTEIHDAWEAAYWQLANIFINREKQIYSEAQGWTDWREFVLDKRVKESDEVTSFYWKPKDGKALPAFKPGQYISVQTKVPHFEWTQSRQYSLSASPNPQYYRISVKKETGLSASDPSIKNSPGWISNVLHDTFKEGDVIEMSHPQGEFFLDTKGKNPVVLISAGIGLTPLVSMLETVTAEKSERKVSWIHISRNDKSQAFAKHIQELLKNNANSRSVIFHSDANSTGECNIKGRLDLDKVDKKDLILEDNTTEYYVCGPEQFMVGISKKLVILGVDVSRVKSELFGTGGVPN